MASALAPLKVLIAIESLGELPKPFLPKDSKDCATLALEALERLKQLSERSVHQISPSAFSKIKESPSPPSESSDPSPVPRKRARLKSPDFSTSSSEKQTPSTSPETIAQDQLLYAPIEVIKMIEAISNRRSEKDSCKQIIGETEINLLVIRYYLSEMLKYLDENELPTFDESNLTLITTIGSIPPGPEHDEELINAIAACKA